MVKVKIVSLFAAVSMSLAGCEGMMPSKEAIGTIGGAGLGALVGSRFGGGEGRVASVAVGTLLGAVAGNLIGKSMDSSDTVATQTVLEKAETGQPVAWTNPKTKAQYKVTPTKTYKDESGQDCREYKTVGVIDGKRETINGTACRQDDGTWKATEQATTQ